MYTLRLLLALMGLALVSTSSLARGEGKHMEKILQQLNLNEDQKSKIHEVHQSAQEGIKKARTKAHASREAFHQAVADPQTTEEKLKSLHEEMISAKATMMRARFDKMVRIRAVLEGKQREEFHKLMGGQHRWKKGHRGKNHGN